MQGVKTKQRKQEVEGELERMTAVGTSEKRQELGGR